MNTVDLVCLGDSIVYGYGTDAHSAWPYVAAKRLGIRILNRGENGDTAAGMNARFSEDVLREHPKEVFIMAGSNDILMGTDLPRTCECVDLMVRKAVNARISPLIGIPIQVDGDMLKQCWYSCFSIEDTMALFRKYREWLIRYCNNEQIPYVDFQKKFPEYLERKGVRWAYQDGVHPTREGYGVLADIFCDTYIKIKGICE